jgi:hypothetical protein
VAGFRLREPTEGVLVASYDFSVWAWEVQTTMHFAEQGSTYDPFDIQIIAIHDDLRSSLIHNPVDHPG